LRTAEEINAAIGRVETAKRNHPIGWVFLDELGLPGDAFVAYAFANADVHVRRLAGEDARVVYAAGWLQGLAVGASLD
jgi:hypothetical protein